MRLHLPWLLAPLSLAAGCGLLAEADLNALPSVEAGIDAPDADRADADRPDADDAARDAADARDVPRDDGAADMDRPDAMDAADAGDALDAMDAADAGDALDAMDATDAMVAADAMDAADAGDGRDAADAMDVRDAADVTHAADVTDAADATDARDGSDVTDARDGSDVLDGPIPLCTPVTRLLAPTSNSVSTGPLVRFSFVTVPGITRYRVAVCTRRGCLGGVTRWSREVTTTAPTESVAVPAGEASSLPPAVYWWSVTALGAACTPVASDPWELRVGVTPAATSGDAAWWGAYTDFNSDGYADLAVGDPAPSGGAPGVVYVHHGAPDELPSRPSTTLSRTTAGFAQGVSSAGDFNGDGYGDLVVTTSNGVLVFFGGAAGLDGGGGLAPTGIPTSASEVRAVGVGDVNGDGFGDLVARASVGGALRVYFAAGSAGAASFVELLRPVDPSSPTPCPFYGQSVAPAGNVNGDHLADFVLGCPSEVPGGASVAAPARAFVLLGDAAFPRAPVAVVLRPPSGSDVRSSFGHLVAGVGNATGTRRTVVAVGDEGHANHLHLFEFGPEDPPVATVAPAPPMLPSLLSALRPLTAMTGLGNVNRDGVGDYLLAVGNTLLPLVVLVPSGAAPARFVPSVLLDPVISLAGAGDFESDGFDDFAVGFRVLLGGGRVQLFPGASSYGALLSAPTSAVLAEPAGRTRYALSLAAGR